MSVKYCLPVPVFHFWRALYCILQCGLSAIAEHLVFVTQRSRHNTLSPPTVEDFARVSLVLPTISILTNHISNITANCARTLYALRIHDMPAPTLHAIFHSTALAKLTYAAPVWWEFANSAERNGEEAFCMSSHQIRYSAHFTPTT